VTEATWAVVPPAGVPGAAPVSNDQVNMAASAAPAALRIEGVSVAAIVVLAGSAGAGRNVAVDPEQLTAPGTGPVALVRTKDDAVTVVQSSVWVNTATTGVRSGTAMRPAAGVTSETAGAAGGAAAAAAVVKLQVPDDASGFAARSIAPVEMVAVYWVDGASAASGVNTATSPAQSTAPPTGPAAEASVKVAALTVAQLIGSEKRARTVVATGASDALAAGPSAATVGAVVSRTAPVVKDQPNIDASAAPVVSLTAGVSVAAYDPFAASGAAGVNVAVAPEQVTVPATGPAPLERRKDDDVTVAQSSARVKVALTAVFGATPASDAAGLTVATTAKTAGFGASCVVDWLQPASARISVTNPSGLTRMEPPSCVDTHR
jgi:hypothetical protein